ncbi:hypothetical protein [Mycobacterium sp. 050134]
MSISLLLETAQGGGLAEVLVTKPGKGSLSIGTTPMVIMEAKPLPASD